MTWVAEPTASTGRGTDVCQATPQHSTREVRRTLKAGS